VKRPLELLAVARARLLFRDCERGRRVRAFGDVRVLAEGRIVLRDGVFFEGGLVRTSVLCHAGAEIAVGDGSGFGYGVLLEARKRITVGKRCRFGAMVRLSDTMARSSAPIVIEDDVWIAHGALVYPGVTIGAGSMVSAGSVVVSDVPPGRMAIGNPARPVEIQGTREA
jgi:maltose O-acetyltransferase